MFWISGLGLDWSIGVTFDLFYFIVLSYHVAVSKVMFQQLHIVWSCSVLSTSIAKLKMDTMSIVCSPQLRQAALLFYELVAWCKSVNRDFINAVNGDRLHPYTKLPVLCRKKFLFLKGQVEVLLIFQCILKMHTV